MNEKTIRHPVRQDSVSTPEASATGRPRLVEHDGVRFNKPDTHELMSNQILRYQFSPKGRSSTRNERAERGW